MNIKQRIKEFSLFYQINAKYKARLQERLASKEIKYYLEEASRSAIKEIEGEFLANSLKKHLAKRDLFTVPKQKGELHVFLAFPLSNWESVLPVSLEPFGHVSIFEWRSLGFNDQSPNWLTHRDSMNKAMLEAFLKANSERPVDAVVGYLSGYNTDPEILLKMGKAGAVILNFNWDDKLRFHGKICGGRWTGPAALASAVDLNLTSAPDSRIKYFVEGGLAMFWPEAAHPDIHKPYDVPFEFDVSFVGAKYGWRPKFINKLQQMGLNIACFGRGWDNGSLPDEEMVKLYSRSRINLGFAGIGHSKRLMCLKGRDFEVPMSGGLYLTQDNPELSLVYDVGKEIVTYRDEIDCAEKINWLLANTEEQDRIRKAGWKRSTRDHSWGERFQEVFHIVGLIENE